MAKCEYCGKEMSKSSGCDCIIFMMDGLSYKRTVFAGDKNEKCPDCGCHFGRYHHPGCRMEICPICGGQLLSCCCRDGDIDMLVPRRFLTRRHK